CVRQDYDGYFDVW
nr:immunoglobulin heavy chain junction region [Mus musculus]MBK4195267.1 immunoglobulin heavy chain junction region [Mus musculus]MBK4195268.1 immunoglobulin heavy chain junction region [Mus musculus]MBK4195269.1 immunoglobulin heavy chain junction region [Mus musculus]